MKNIKILSLLFIFTFTFMSCEEDNDSLTGNENIGGLLTIEKKLVSYVIGDGTSLEYKNTFSAYQGEIKVTKVNIYKKFNDTNGTPIVTDDKESNEVLLRTIDVPTIDQFTNVEYSVTYLQLIEGLNVNGVPMSSDDTNLNIGDYFTLRYESFTSDGKVVQNSLSTASTKVAAGTRLAGTYKCLDALYYRIGVLTADTSAWPAETIIESVDATTYRVVERFGYFPAAANDDNTWYFKVVGNTISYPAQEPDGSTAQTGNGQPFITCESNPASFNTEVNCGNSNYVVLDNVNGGKDKLYMTFGYLSPNGPRVFYQVLEKKL
jgi:hypothetical protein